jgi:hypothetical protein
VTDPGSSLQLQCCDRERDSLNGFMVEGYHLGGGVGMGENWLKAGDEDGSMI